MGKTGIDTGFFLRVLRGDKRAWEVFDCILENVQVVVSSVVLFELRKLAYDGILNKEAVGVLEEIVKRAFKVVPVDEEVALRAAAIMHGTGISPVDAFVYASYADCSEIITDDKDRFKGVQPRLQPRVVTYGEWLWKR